MFKILQQSKGQTLADAYPQINIDSARYASNNQYSKYPPMMSDGRSVVASWQPGSQVNEAILREHNIQSNWQYRKYMTTNATQIRERLFHDALNDVGYTVRNQNKEINSNGYQGPKLYGSLLDPSVDSLSDLKQDYLTRQQLESKMVVPSLTQAQLQEMHISK